MKRDELVETLSELLTAPANDALRLTFGQEISPKEIRKLDLRAVTKFKRTEKGAFEFECIDRMKLAELLLQGCNAEEGRGAMELMEALRHAD